MFKENLDPNKEDRNYLKREQFAVSLRKKKKDEILKVKRRKIFEHYTNYSKDDLFQQLSSLSHHALGKSSPA
jgi:hypothetical protein